MSLTLFDPRKPLQHNGYLQTHMRTLVTIALWRTGSCGSYDALWFHPPTNLYPAALTSNASHSGSTFSLFARRRTKCPPPTYLCSNIVGYCCSTGTNCQYTQTGLPGCCPEEALTCGRGYCLGPGQTCCSGQAQACDVDYTSRTINGETGCCPNTAETCGGRFCLSLGQTCCGSRACDSDTYCKTSSGGRQSCCASADAVACEHSTCKRYRPLLVAIKENNTR